MAAVEKLQELGLVSKICTELDSHLGLADKTLAEFIIHLAGTVASPQAFRSALDENGAEFPEALCIKLWSIIKTMQPGGGAKQAAHLHARPAKNDTESAFPGLRLENTAPVELD
jgi:ATP-dependent RNA helicase DHX8/PRP22